MVTEHNNTSYPTHQTRLVGQCPGQQEATSAAAGHSSSPMLPLRALHLSCLCWHSEPQVCLWMLTSVFSQFYNSHFPPWAHRWVLSLLGVRQGGGRAGWAVSWAQLWEPAQPHLLQSLMAARAPSASGVTDRALLMSWRGWPQTETGQSSRIN